MRYQLVSLDGNVYQCSTNKQAILRSCRNLKRYIAKLCTVRPLPDHAVVSVATATKGYCPVCKRDHKG